MLLFILFIFVLVIIAFDLMMFFPPQRVNNQSKISTENI